MNEELNNNVSRCEFTDEMNSAYINYAMSVIKSRAIPDIRDGLKPVQRRVIYDMNELRLTHDKPHKKCARIVGDTMGKYHPHGDSSIYDTLVVMSQDFKKSVTYIDGHGNFGSIEGDSAAAMRYTEARLERFTEDVLLKDLTNTVDFVSNYDGTETEPEILPAKLPLLLINGSEGIAVGMATSIPSHNLSEVCDLCIAYLQKPKMTLEEMLKIMKGPDFATGGIIANKNDLSNIYKTGSGKIKVRGKMEFEKATKRGEKDRLVITEIPYTMIGSGISKLLNDIAALVIDKTLPEVIDLSNQSNKKGIRIVLELKPNADIDRIQNILYKKTKLEDTFGVNMLAIRDRQPCIFSLNEILKSWSLFQYELLKKKYTALYKDEEAEKEILEGLIKACDMIDLIIEIIRGSKTVSDAKKCLTTGDVSKITFRLKTSQAKAKKLTFTARQADAILRMQLQKLIGLELEALKKNFIRSEKKLKEYKSILSSKKKQNDVLIKELLQIKKEYPKKRLTSIKNCKEAHYEELIEVFDAKLLIDKFRYCKMVDIPTYERNIEAINANYKVIKDIKSDDVLYLFSSQGQCYQMNATTIPLTKYKDKGIPIENLLGINSSESILYLCTKNELDSEFIFITKNGYIKKVNGTEFITSRKMIHATKLNKDDFLLEVIPFNKEQYLLLYNKNQYGVKMNTSSIPLLKKTSIGVKGIQLDDDLLIGGILLNNKDTISLFERDILGKDIKTGKRGTKGKKF